MFIELESSLGSLSSLTDNSFARFFHCDKFCCWHKTLKTKVRKWNSKIVAFYQKTYVTLRAPEQITIMQYTCLTLRFKLHLLNCKKTALIYRLWKRVWSQKAGKQDEDWIIKNFTHHETREKNDFFVIMKMKMSVNWAVSIIGSFLIENWNISSPKKTVETDVSKYFACKKLTRKQILNLANWNS